MHVERINLIAIHMNIVHLKFIKSRELWANFAYAAPIYIKQLEANIRLLCILYWFLEIFKCGKHQPVAGVCL